MIHRYRILTSSFCCILVALLLSACASLDDMDTVTIRSEPSGADVKIGNDYVGKTPLVVEMKRILSHTVTITMEGYETYRIDVMPVPNESSKNTVKFGFLKESGAYNSLYPNPIDAKLRKKDTTW